MASPTSADRTISIPVSLATHVVIGCLIALVALAAMFAYFQLPNSHHRSVALTITVIASAGALSYWLWCASQCLRADVRANAVAIEDARDEARAETRAAKAEVLARHDTSTDRLDARISGLGEDVADHSRSIKELTDAFEANTAAMIAMTKAFKVLRECYLQQGTAQDAHDKEPKEAPPEDW